METVNNVRSISDSEELPISPNAMSALGYFIGIIAVVALVMKQYQKESLVKFHAIQSLLFQGTWIVGYMTVAIVTAIFSSMLGLVFRSLEMYSLLSVLLMIPWLVGLLFSGVMFVTWIVLIVSASQGKQIKLPILGKMAERMAR